MQINGLAAAGSYGYHNPTTKAEALDKAIEERKNCMTTSGKKILQNSHIQNTLIPDSTTAALLVDVNLSLWWRVPVPVAFIPFLAV